jgi:hypothetical protein
MRGTLELCKECWDTMWQEHPPETKEYERISGTVQRARILS